VGVHAKLVLRLSEVSTTRFLQTQRLQDAAGLAGLTMYMYNAGATCYITNLSAHRARRHATYSVTFCNHNQMLFCTSPLLRPYSSPTDHNTVTDYDTELVALVLIMIKRMLVRMLLLSVRQSGPLTPAR
jgi:hypothetical protein